MFPGLLISLIFNLCVFRVGGNLHKNGENIQTRHIHVEPQVEFRPSCCAHACSQSDPGFFSSFFFFSEMVRIKHPHEG